MISGDFNIDGNKRLDKFKELIDYDERLLKLDEN